jgi:hypothetical protein
MASQKNKKPIFEEMRPFANKGYRSAAQKIAFLKSVL